MATIFSCLICLGETERAREWARRAVLIDPDKKSVELYRRGDDGYWVLRDIVPDSPLELTSVGATVSWERLFRNVD